jgi:calcium-dependent protein kinase
MGACTSKNAIVRGTGNRNKGELEPCHSTVESAQTPRKTVERITPSVMKPPMHNGPDTSSQKSSNNFNKSGKDYLPGYSSGASTPSALDGSNHSNVSGSAHNNPKSLQHSSSVLGLDKLINDRRADGDLKNNIVHMEVPFGKPIEEVYDGIHDGPVLGSGISGLVRLCTHRGTQAKYAVKCLDLGLVETEEGLQQLREEIAIMCQLDHPNIVRLEEVYESHSEIYLVQELCVGGELFDRLDEQPDYHYTESQCARLVKQMLCSVRYCHSKGIIHRDLKLENFLFSTNSADSELKMIDFGLSKHFKYGEVQHEAVGTPYTVAPEVIHGSYDERCDVWAIGVITYLLLSGDPPFGGCGGPESLMQVRSNILAGRFKFEPKEIWEHVSQDAMDFIRKLLITDPTNRPTARTCQTDKWLHEWANKSKKAGDNLLNKDVVKALVNFKEYSDMRKLLCEVLSFTLLPDQITDLRKEFEKLDIDGSGEISLKGLKHVLMQGAGAGSLGALTEEEVEDIFNAMRVRKTETRIHWHEFIAAGLSQCKVDDRNLRLAFDRLDADHKGYVTFDNIMDMMGRDGAESEDEMRDMWANSMKACSCHDSQVTYEDFLLLMKGQTMATKEPAPRKTLVNAPAPVHMVLVGQSFLSKGGGNLEVLHEYSDEEPCPHTPEPEAELVLPFRPSAFGIEAESEPRRSSTGFGMPSVSFEDFDDAPITMDEDDDELDARISESADRAMQMRALTPPQSPIRSPKDFVTPTADRFGLSPTNFVLNSSLPMPVLPDSDFYRRRSKSVDDQDNISPPDDLVEHDHDHIPTQIVPDIRRAVLLPEHIHSAKQIETVKKDDVQSNLVANRKLYRAHRQMRLAVLEASKRFEDQQLRRTKAELQAQQHEDARHFGAGLVMRRGHKKELSTDAIRSLMSDRQTKQKSMFETAARRGGRGKRARKKTVSDMSGMLLSIPSDEMKIISTATPVPLQEVEEDRIPDQSEHELHLHDITKPQPTVVGVFRKTSDPFHLMGKQMLDVWGKAFPNSVESPAKPPELADAENSSSTRSLVGIDSPSLARASSAIKVSVSDGELQSMTPEPETP